MTDLLGIGASGIRAYGGALGVIGDNVANAETPGYARREITIGESAATGSSNPFYRGGIAGDGADATGVTRAWDDFKATDARAATADDGRATAASTWLATGQSAIDDSDNGVGAKVSAVFTAANTLAADPTSATARAGMLGAIGDAAQAIGGAAKALATTSGGIVGAAANAVAGVNDDLQALGKLNLAIRRTPDGSSAKATLADQRDQLLDDLTSKIGVDAKVAADGGATVTLAGNAQAILLSGQTAGLVAVSAATDGRLSLTLGIGAAVQAIQPTGGVIAGLVDAANGVAGSRASLNGIASGFAAQVNGWNARGRTAAGPEGGPLLSVQDGASSLTLASTSPADIAAAGDDGTANGNLLAFADLRGSDGAEAKLAALVGANAQAVASASARAAAAATRKAAALTTRDDVSGVSLDVQAADLVRYQQAYAGSAKVIQAAQTALQSILALFGG